MLSGRAFDRRRWPEPLLQPEQGSWRTVVDSVHSHTQRVFEEPAKFCLIGVIRRLSDGSPVQNMKNYYLLNQDFGGISPKYSRNGSGGYKP
jgi:hypothetical protein